MCVYVSSSYVRVYPSGCLCVQFFFNLKFLAAPGLPCCMWAFSSFSDWGLLSICSARASHWSGFSCSRTPALGHVGFSICGHSLSCPAACGFILGSSWALAGGFLTTGPPEKSCVYSFFFFSVYILVPCKTGSVCPLYAHKEMKSRIFRSGLCLGGV